MCKQPGKKALNRVQRGYTLGNYYPTGGNWELKEEPLKKNTKREKRKGKSQWTARNGGLSSDWDTNKSIWKNGTMGETIGRRVEGKAEPRPVRRGKSKNL